MNRVFVQVLPVLAIVALGACSSNAMNQSLFPHNPYAAQQSAALPPDALAGSASGDVPFRSPNPVRRLCPTPGTAERMQCFAMVRTDVTLSAAFDTDVRDEAEKCPFEGEAYCPNDLQAAYDLPSLKAGSDRVVAIVDAYGYKHAAPDLAVYRKTMGLKPCVTETKCLRIVNQEGNPSPLPPEPPPSDDWKGEQATDLDMVSAICPNCRIILVQTNSDYTSDLYPGVKTAGRFARYVGASWGGAESGPDNSDFHQNGVVISAAAGDNGGGGKYGGGPLQPCTYTYVVCVGGTHLVRAGNKRGWNENVWNDLNFDECGNGNSPCGATGSACSRKISKPAWQNDTGCKMRSAADTSVTASLRAPVAVYISEEGGSCPAQCFYGYGGTSVATQIISAVYALAGNASSQSGGMYLWKHHAGHVNDVTMGNNTDPAIGSFCASSVKYICVARAGFDGPTGWGTPEGVEAF